MREKTKVLMVTLTLYGEEHGEEHGFLFRLEKLPRTPKTCLKNVQGLEKVKEIKISAFHGVKQLFCCLVSIYFDSPQLRIQQKQTV